MPDQVEEIVAGFLKIPVGQVNVNTAIDRSAMKSSIVVHRFYAALSSAGFPVKFYTDITTVGELLTRLNGSAGGASQSTAAPVYNPSITGSGRGVAQIGIDIENLANFPKAIDFREDEFYVTNFAAAEISHCILQQDPYQSFAGLFAAKEAMVKADNSLRQTAFNELVVTHNHMGKPEHPAFDLSITHNEQIACAVAIAVATTPGSATFTLPVSNQHTKSSVSYIALVVALTALLVVIILLLKKF